MINSEGDIAHVSVDGVDFVIREPTPFNPSWFSFKHNGFI